MHTIMVLQRSVRATGEKIVLHWSRVYMSIYIQVDSSKPKPEFLFNNIWINSNLIYVEVNTIILRNTAAPNGSL